MTIPLSPETKQQAIARCRDRVQACIVARSEAYKVYCVNPASFKARLRFDSATRDLIEAKAKLEKVVKLYEEQS